MSEPELGAFRPIPYMGVIWVVAEAMKLGFHNGHPDWYHSKEERFEQFS